MIPGIAVAAGAVHGAAFGAGQPAYLQFGGVALFGALLFRLRAARRWGLLGMCIAGFWLASNAFGLRWMAGAITGDEVLGVALGGVVYGFLCLGLSVVTVASLWAAVRLSAPLHHDALCCAFYSSAILAAELLRESVLPSFPWLVVGYAHLDSPFAVLFPFLGVEGLGWVVLFAELLVGAAGAYIATRRRTPVVTLVCLLLVCSAVALAVREAPTLTRDAGTLRAAVMQTAMPGKEKFKATLLGRHIMEIGDFTRNHDAQLIVTPETAVPTTLRALTPAQEQYLAHGITASRALLFGAFAEDSRGDVFNSAVMLQQGAGPTPQVERTVYIKQHLAPIGEYAPPGFKWIADLLNLPMSNLRSTDDSPRNFRLLGVTIIPSVCQDLLYGGDLRTTVDGPRLLVNLSNVEFFNDALARAQFLNIARARALEQQVPVLIAANYGPTAYIDAQSVVRQQLPSAAIDALEVTVRMRAGSTPYARYGRVFLYLMFLLTSVAIAGAAWRHRLGSLGRHHAKLPAAAG
jgi:apolipoprotein N-acyltransferase